MFSVEGLPLLSLAIPNLQIFMKTIHLYQLLLSGPLLFCFLFFYLFWPDFVFYMSFLIFFIPRLICSNLILLNCMWYSSSPFVGCITLLLKNLCIFMWLYCSTHFGVILPLTLLYVLLYIGVKNSNHKFFIFCIYAV